MDSNHAGYTGTGFANTNNATNAGVRWRVNATAAGNFTLQWRFANGTTGNRPGSLRVNGTTLSTVALAGHRRLDHLDELGQRHGGIESWRQ